MNTSYLVRLKKNNRLKVFSVEIIPDLCFFTPPNLSGQVFLSFKSRALSADSCHCLLSYLVLMAVLSVTHEKGSYYCLKTNLSLFHQKHHLKKIPSVNGKLGIFQA